MSIAILGWGSLIWCPRELQVATAWRKDGPQLPIEFARKSADGRVTLVVAPGSPLVQTYWAESACETADTAIENLCAREGTLTKWIHKFPGRDVDASIAAWASQHPDVTDVLWTGLEATFPVDARAELVVGYLNGLSEPVLSRAREYVEFAPAQIDTPVRKEIERVLKWPRRNLPARLFESQTGSEGTV